MDDNKGTMGLANVAAAFATGRSHHRSGAPCQDFADGRRRRSVAAIALADGAGSRANSALGAKVAVTAALRLLTSSFDALSYKLSYDPDEARKLVMKTVRASLDSAAKRFECEFDSLACTLLFVAAKQTQYVAGHIGDGAIAMVDLANGPTVLSHPDNGEYANTTYFVTDRGAEDRLRLYMGSVVAGGFVLMSDGTAEVLYEKSKRTVAPGVSQLVDWNRRLRRPKVERILRRNLDGPLAKSSDDLSLALLSTPHS